TAADCIFPSRGTARAVVSFAFGFTCTSGLPPYITDPFGGGLLWANAAVEQASTATSTTNDLMSPYPLFHCAPPLQSLRRASPELMSLTDVKYRRFCVEIQPWPGL